MDAPSLIGPRASGLDRTSARKAWTAFWQEPDAASFHCLSSTVEVSAILTTHWASFSEALPPDARVLDLGCGAGAVAHALVQARGDVHVTGVDFAKIPLVIHAQAELLADTAMEFLPFEDASFSAVVSQFGFEYSRTQQAARELARVLPPGAHFSLLAHHAGSDVIAGLAERLRALVALVDETTQASFCGGDVTAFNARLAALQRSFPFDPVIAKLAQALPARVTRAQRERIAIWNAVADALAPERCILEAVQAACVAPEDLDEWLGPLCSVCDVSEASALRVRSGAPIAWRIEGVR